MDRGAKRRAGNVATDVIAQNTYSSDTARFDGQTGDTIRNCDHKHCLARKIIDAYNRYKSVLVIGGKQREAAVVQAPSSKDMKEQRFHVVKTNNMGRRQKRILVVDQQRQEIRSFDEQMRLRVILPLNKLHQLENLEADERSLELSFEEGVYSYCELQFIAVEERTRFIECIMVQHESVEKNKKETNDEKPMNQLRRYATMQLVVFFDLMR